MKRCKDCKWWQQTDRRLNINNPSGKCNKPGYGPDDGWGNHANSQSCSTFNSKTIPVPNTRKWWRFWPLKLLLIACLLIGGCAMLEHTDKDGNVTKYFRVGPQNIDFGSITLPDGSVLNFAGQEAELPTVVVTATSITVGGKDKP